jgi:TonB-dependent receptor
MRRIRRWLVTALCAVTMANLSAAASLSGRVRDANTQSFLLGATVTIRELNREARTDRDGGFTVYDVPPGTYTVVVSYLGYNDVTQSVTVSNEERRTDFALGAEIVSLGAFVVEGNREGQARALQQKRTADNVLDVVASDSIGKLPDGNAGEAVRRLPGVIAEIDQGEGRYIVVRGIDAALNNITVNGVAIGSPESGTRGVAMDAVPADLISRIEVVKAVTPDMDANAIGASVNIVTPSAFDREGAFAYGTLGAGFNTGNDHIPYNASATYGTTFGGGKWGVIVGGSYSFRHYNSHRMSTNGAAWLPRGTGGFVPQNQTFFLYDVQRWRWGVNAALEYRPDARSQYFLRTTYNRFEDEEGREQTNFDFVAGTLTNQTPTSGHYSQGRASAQYRHYEQEHTIANYSLGGKNTLGDGSLKLDYTFATGVAEKQTPSRIDWEFRSAANAFPNDYDTSRPEFRVMPTPNFYTGVAYPFRRVRFRADDEHEDNWSAIVNLRRNQSLFGKDGYWQVGGRYMSRDKGWNRSNRNFTGAQAFHLGQFELSNPAPRFYDRYYQLSPQVNFQRAQQFFRDSPQFFLADAASSSADSVVTDFQFQEDVLAYYGMARASFGAVSALAGVRAERTEGDFSGTEFRNGALRPLRGNKSYTNVLPGLHLRFTPSKELVMRAALTKTIGRPDYPSIAASREFTFVETAPGSGRYTGTVSEGNAGLQPYESLNFDLTAEYYFQNSGIASISGFHKQIDNSVYTRVETLTNTAFEGLNFNNLVRTRPDNADRGTVTGVEFNYQQQLTRLPSPFDGFGFSANHTIVDSEVKVFSRPGETLPFFKQADSVSNIAIFYEKYGFQARLAWARTGDYLVTVGGNRDEDQYRGTRRTVDARLSYRLSKRFRIFADALNLTREPLTEYSGQPGRGTASEIYWYTATFGINWNL